MKFLRSLFLCLTALCALYFASSTAWEWPSFGWARTYQKPLVGAGLGATAGALAYLAYITKDPNLKAAAILASVAVPLGGGGAYWWWQRRPPSPSPPPSSLTQEELQEKLPTRFKAKFGNKELELKATSGPKAFIAFVIDKKNPVEDDFYKRLAETIYSSLDKKINELKKTGVSTKENIKQAIKDEMLRHKLEDMRVINNVIVVLLEKDNNQKTFLFFYNHKLSSGLNLIPNSLVYFDTNSNLDIEVVIADKAKSIIPVHLSKDVNLKYLILASEDLSKELRLSKELSFLEKYQKALDEFPVGSINDALISIPLNSFSIGITQEELRKQREEESPFDWASIFGFKEKNLKFRIMPISDEKNFIAFVLDEESAENKDDFYNTQANEIYTLLSELMKNKYGNEEEITKAISESIKSKIEGIEKRAGAKNLIVALSVNLQGQSLILLYNHTFPSGTQLKLMPIFSLRRFNGESYYGLDKVKYVNDIAVLDKWYKGPDDRNLRYLILVNNDLYTIWKDLNMPNVFDLIFEKVPPMRNVALDLINKTRSKRPKFSGVMMAAVIDERFGGPSSSGKEGVKKDDKGKRKKQEK